jgi:hypothetical protein
MSESTKTLECVTCGIQIVPTGDGGYTHTPRMEDPQTGCTDPRPARTITRLVAEMRRTTPGPFAALACMLGHTYRVVLERNQPIALECVNCATTWKTERVEREQPSA